MNIQTQDHPGYHRRELLIDGQAACWLFIADHTLRIGAARVTMAGIAAVETRPEHRMKGLMRALIEDTIGYMTGAGYDVSMLFGIPNFYTRFGYAVCLADGRMTMQTRDAELAGAQSPGGLMRPIDPGDWPAILELSGRHNALRTASLVRNPERFTSFPKGSTWFQPVDSTVIEDGGGRFAGYAVWDRAADRVDVVEVEAADDRWFPALLAEFAQLAIARRCGHITFHLPPDHPFAEYVQRYGCEWTIRHPRHGGGMLRMLNQAAVFEKLKPELERRLAARRLPGPSAALALITDLGTIVLSTRDGALSLAQAGAATASLQLSQDRLTQLVIGYRSARDVLNDPQVTATGEVLPWLEVLFPKGRPYCWAADEF